VAEENVAVTVFQNAQALATVQRRSGLRRAMQRKSVIAFLMTLPLILLVAIFVLYPALYSLHLATLNKSMERFVGFGNFEFLFRRETFWMVVKQSCIFRRHGRRFQGALRFHHRPFRPQRPEQGPAQVARHAAGAMGDPPAMSCLLAVAVRSVLQRVQLAAPKGGDRSSPVDG
jgi:ABC-type sugar transport systems, permease components